MKYLKDLVFERMPRVADEIDSYLTTNEILVARCKGVGYLGGDQAIAYGGGQLEESQVRAMMGTIDSADLDGLIQALHDADPEQLLAIVEHIALQNPDYDALLTELLSLLQKIALIQVLPENSDNPLLGNEKLVEFARLMKPEDVQLYYQIALMGRKDMYLAPDSKSGFEMILIRMLAFRPVAENEIPVSPPPVFDTSAKTSVREDKDVPDTAAEATTESDTVADSAASKDAHSTEKADSDWKSIIDEMALAGLVKELAGNCALKTHTADKVELALSPSQEHLLNSNQKERLEQAIKTRFGEQVQLIISVEDPAHETPAEVRTRQEQERQKAAEESVENDPAVKSLIDTFNATLDKDSIQPN